MMNIFLTFTNCMRTILYIYSVHSVVCFFTFLCQYLRQAWVIVRGQWKLYQLVFYSLEVNELFCNTFFPKS